jgi:hypothetical protein
MLKTTLIIAVALAVACSSASSPVDVGAGSGSGSGSGSSSGSAEIARDSAAHPPANVRHYLERKRPMHTFDFMTARVAPGQSVVTGAYLEPGWTVAGLPMITPDPDASTQTLFVVTTISQKLEGSGVRYEVGATNAGSATARFLADVPCGGCP